MKWKVACVQLNVQFGNPVSNYERAEEWIERASREGVDIIILPEMFTTGYDLTRLNEIADENAETTIHFFQRMAKKYQVYLMGSVANKKTDGVTNTLLVVNKNGELLLDYDKLHLFQLMEEHKYLTSGKKEALFELESEKVAGFICYDIRFPEWIRKPVLQGAKVIFVVAEWPASRLNHWRILLQTRAIENQCFVIACNRSGSDPNNKFAGRSMIIDPWGEILVEGSEKEEVVLGEIDINYVDEIRRRIPIFEDRLPDFYQ